MGSRVVIVSAVRTAVGTFGGSLNGFPIHRLGAEVIAEAVKRAGINAGQVDEVIFGNVNSPAICLNVSREASLRAGIPVEVPAFTVNRQCGSSLQAINLGAMMIMAGEASIVVTGGVENMSNYPYSVYNARWGLRFGDAQLIDDAAATLRDHETGLTSGGAAELLAEKYKISREEQDQFALESQYKAQKAIEMSVFKDEILPLEIKTRKGARIFDIDEHPKPNVTLEKLSRLPAVFKQNGTVTAGNSCGMNDGASALVLMNEEKARELGIRPMARIMSFAVGGVEPAYFGEAPVLGVNLALKKAGLTLDQLDLIECNEAFAAQTIAVERGLRWDRNRLNVNGGAIALGHPLGATGGRLMTTLIYEMQRRGSRYGVATACTGGGMGIATIVRRD
ncbi:MAG: thiolase family protein [Syntrophomonadaceae bacterium]|jgi:acetyl-CoA C-acetyltransferase